MLEQKGILVMNSVGCIKAKHNKPNTLLPWLDYGRHVSGNLVLLTLMETQIFLSNSRRQRSVQLDLLPKPPSLREYKKYWQASRTDPI